MRYLFAIPLCIAFVWVCPPTHAQTFGCTPPAANAVACENSKPGNPPSDWDLPSSGTGDATLQGFATDISVNQGQTVHFKVNTTARAYRIDIYRIGYYGGLGARYITTVMPSVMLPQNQPACLTDTVTGLIDCGNWAESASWAVPSNATSGLYVAKLVRPDTGGTNHMVFVVRSDTGASQVLFQTSDTTWQAYNDWGGNSLYVGSPANRAYKVSYNRPFVTRQGNYSHSWFLMAEYPMIRWLEANGYDVSYTTGVDTDRSGSAILGRKIFLSVGHDEYWSAEQRANVEAARAAGIHLAFFSANEIWWKTRWENSIDGSNTPYRTLVCYKETMAGQRLDPQDPPTWTGSWRDPTFSPPADGARPENALSGTLFYVNAFRNDAVAVPYVYSKLRFWRNTAIAALSPGATYTTAAGILGYEWDQELDNGFRPPGIVDLSSTTLDVSPLFLLDYGATYGSGTATHNLALYRASSGSLVFGAGTIQWSWALDSTHDIFSYQAPPTDRNLQQATVNLLADMGTQPATLQPGLVAASASTDFTPPSSSITSPTAGASLPPGVPVTITGAASDQGGGVVAVVEVSVDGGTTWHRATGQGNWSYVWTPSSLGTVTLKSRAVDDSLNMETPTPGVSVGVVPAGLISIAVTPVNSSLPKGFPAQFTATGTFSGGGTQNLTQSVVWTSSNPAAATITNAGVANGIAPGATTIQAALGSISGSTGLTVTSAVLVSLAVTPANPSISSATTQQFTATGTFSDATTLNLTRVVSWSSTNTTVATINSTGLATGVSGGNTSIQAAWGSISGTTGLTVTAAPGPVAYWKFDDGSGTTAVDSTGNGNTMNLVNGVSWVAGKIGGAISTNGINQYGTVPALNLSGTHTVTVAMWVNRTYTQTGGHTMMEDTPNFNNSTTGFGIFPDDNGTCSGSIMAAVRGDVGYSRHCYSQLSSGVWHHWAVIFDKTQPGSNQVTLYIDGVLQTPLSSPDSAQNTNTFGNDPLYIFSRGGTQEFNAGLMDDLRVYSRALSATEIQQLYQAGLATLVSITVAPANPSIPKGTTRQFTATGTYSDGSTQNLTSSVTWSSSSTAVATISTTGLATGLATGSTTIQATSGSISGTTGLTVTAPALVSIAVTPANASLASGSTLQFTATGTFSDASTQNLTSAVTWSSTNTTVATIASGGLATGRATGTTTIQAQSAGTESGSITGSAGLTVTATLVSIAVTPANPPIPKGTTQQFTATGTYSDGGTVNLTISVSWTSTNTTVATISAAGLATGAATGSTTIQATYGSISGSTGLTVTAPVLVSIALTPANSSILIGATQQYMATGTYTDGSTQNLASSVTWSSSSPAVATITTGGLATGVALGSTTIQATSGSISGSTTLQVGSNLVGWWKFDDGSGTTASDSSGNGHTATLVNGVSWVSGKLGGAISANGTNQYVSIPAIDLSGTNAVTVALWMNRTYNTALGQVLLEDTSNLNSSTTGFGLFDDQYDCNAADVLASLKGNVGPTGNCYADPTSGVWHHLAVVYDKSQAGSSEVTVYIDGALKTILSSPTTSNNTNNFGNNPIYLFSRGGTSLFAAGTFDDLRLYNRVLSASEIQQLYQMGTATLVSIAVTPANGSIAKGATQQYTATGTYSDGSTQNLTSSVTWSSSSTAVATISTTGLATGLATGSTTIQATSGSISGTTGLTVTAPALVSIAVTPANTSIAKGATQQYTATGSYSDGSTQNLTGSVTWTSTNTAAATITSAGLATGAGTGATTIQATLGSISGSTNLTVTAVLASIAVTPANASTPKGTTQQFTATGMYSDGSTLNLTSSVSWLSTSTGVATINAAGLATGIGTGSTTIQATMGSITGMTGLTVTPAALVSIAVTPANSSLNIGAGLQYTATGTYSDGSTQNMTNSVTWSSSNTAAATINSTGMATGVGTGTTTIQATSGSISGSTTLSVAPLGLAAYWKFDDGSGTTAVDSTGNGNTMTLVNGVSWVAGKIGGAISTNGTNQYGTVAALNLSSTSTVTVAMWLNRTYTQTGGHTLLEDTTNFNNSTTGFGLFPDDSGTCGGAIMVSLNGNAGYNVRCFTQPSSGTWHHLVAIYDKTQPASSQISLYIDGVLQSPRSSPSLAQNTNAFGNNPLYIFSRGGTQEFNAGLMDDLRVYSRALSATEIQQLYQAGLATLVSIAVTPANGSIAKGATQQFTATGTYSDSSTQNLTGSVTWTSTNTAVATITSAGLATGAATGSTTIQASLGSVSGSTGLTVAAPVLVSIAVTPTNSSIAKGATQQFTATGTYSDSSTQNLTGSVTWTSTNTAAATITSAGLATGVATGITTIQATAGSITGSTSLTVIATLVSIAVTPANTSIGKGATQQFTATGTYSDGGTLNLTSSVTWASMNTAVATIASAGLATGVAGGSTTIQASLGSVNGSTGLTVTAPVLLSIAVTPANPTIAIGAAQQFTATATYSDNSTQNLTSSVTWTSTNTSVATITSAGLATGVAAGSTTIRAALGPITGSTGLTVTTSLSGGIDGGATSNGACNPSASCTISTSSAPAVGETVLFYAWWSGQSLTATLTDDGGNGYHTIAGPTNLPGTTIRAQVWYAVNTGSPTNFTVTLSGVSTSGAFDGVLAQVISITGLDRNNPLDSGTVATAIGSGTNLSVTSGVPAVANEMMWGVFLTPFPVTPWTPGVGWINASGQEAVSDGIYRNISHNVAQTPTETASNSSSWIAYTFGFRTAP